MNVSVLGCQIPAEVKRNCRIWHNGRDTNMYRLMQTGMFNPEGLLAEAEREIKNIDASNNPSHHNELDLIRKFAEGFILRDAAELALQQAAEKLYKNGYKYSDAVEYFRLCWLEYQDNGY